MIDKLSSLFILFTAVLLISFGTGCGEKERETPQTGEDTTTMMNGEMDTTSQMDDSITVTKETVPDITGTWSGSFDRRATTLKITEQDSSTFKGNITINYRDVINQQVSGEIDLEKNTFTMNDLLHHRFAGTYSGSISDDYKSLEGTFTGKTDNRKVQFNLELK